MALAPTTSDRPYGRSIVPTDSGTEIMIARWRAGASCAPHDHGGSHGFVIPLRGAFEETRYQWRGNTLVALAPIARPANVAFAVDDGLIHAMQASALHDDAVTLHVYAPAPTHMRLFDLVAQTAITVVGDAGAWLSDDHRVSERVSFAELAPTTTPTIWVGYTINYRGGSAEFAVAAKTLAADLARQHSDPGVEIVIAPLQHKRDFVAAMASLSRDGKSLRELHFVGHSGMYGIMFGSVAWPEQFSPHEWRELTTTIPFAADGRAYFHACRTGRWFAPFFARTFGVTAFGHHGYTTVSARADRFAWAGPRPTSRDKLYLVATPGKKSHGVLGTLRKYRGAAAEPMLACQPTKPEGETSYDAVADLYDRAWADIRVRRPEWKWIQQRAAALTKPVRMLEIGCGNGALLRALSPHLASGVGLDDSAAMVEKARARSSGLTKLRFERIHGPTIALPDNSIDVVVTFLSFRYLDWDPIMNEIRRVLVPGGSLWLVDMVERPVSLRESPKLVRSAIDHVLTPWLHPTFARDVKALTAHPDWKMMLKYNPIRAEHEYRWYLESRFPSRKLEILNVTPNQRVVAFDTGPLPKGSVAPLSFP